LQNPGKPIEEWLKLQAQNKQPKGLEHVAGMVNGKPSFANFHSDTGKYTDQQGNEIPNFVPQPQAAQLGPVVVMPSGKVERATPGTTLEPGAMTVSQVGSGAAADVKQGKAEATASANLDSELGLMQQFAAHPSATNDAAMLMHYIGATKPESMGKIRLNENEIRLFGGTRSSLGDMQALLSKVENGQSLTPQQRQDMLNTMGMIAKAAKRGGGQQGGGGQTIYARDPQGNLHQAAAGTPLPAGWKEEKR
jgi:hypothetical protein